MPMFERLKAYLRGYPTAPPGTTNVIPVGRGPRVYVNANGDVTYATCVKVLAQNMAQQKWSVYDSKNTVDPGQVPGIGYVLNCQPYPGINAFDFWEYIEKQRLGTGNAYALISYNRLTQLQYLVPLDSRSVTVMWDDANILDGSRKLVYQYTDPRNGQIFTILPEEILHFKAFSSNGIVGRSALDVLRDSLMANAEVESAFRTAVRNGFSGTIVLSYTSDLSPSRQKVLQEQVKELLSNSNSTVLPLPAGMTATNITNDIRGYYETLKNLKVEDISGLFGVPLAMFNKMGGTGAATFSTNQMMQFFTNTIRPIIAQYATELTSKLLSRRQQDAGYQVMTINDPLDNLDEQAKASVLASYTGAGIMTPNEARASLHYPQSEAPGADELSQIGGTGALGDSPENEGGSNK